MLKFGNFVIIYRVRKCIKGKNMKVLESAENYLETIYILNKKSKKGVHSVDIAHELNYSKPSISVAMKNLKENGFINIDEQGHITLTESGAEVAEKIYERHTLLTKWLISLGVDRETAAEDACKIEHVISEKSIEAIKKGLDLK